MVKNHDHYIRRHPINNHDSKFRIFNDTFSPASTARHGESNGLIVLFHQKCGPTENCPSFKTQEVNLDPMTISC